jgi:Arc/MetJ family transcription regulator
VKKTLHIDEELLAEAKRAAGASTDTETVRLGLEALIRSAAYQRMRSLLGSEKAKPVDVPRRREPARSRSTRRSA